MKILPELFIAPAEAIGWVLVHSLWQGAAIAAVAAALLAALRRRSASSRHAVCMTALACMILAAAVTAWRVWPERLRATPIAAFPQPSETSFPVQNSVGVNGAFAPKVAALEEPAQNVQGPPSVHPLIERPFAWLAWLKKALPWLSALWLLGVVLVSLRHALGWRRLYRWRRSSPLAPPRLQSVFARLLERLGRSGVSLLECAEVTVPMLTGAVKPVVLFPARMLTGLAAEEIEALLAHELAHFARGDAWSNLLQLALETLFFFHPTVWWLGGRARTERENAADDLALELCADRQTYASALTRVAEMQLLPDSALAASGGGLFRRIERIVRPKTSEASAPGWALGLPALVLLIGVGVFLQARADEPKAIEVAPGASIQAAIDAAPPGALIHLPAGEWKERIRISKPLTLEGAGWDKTTIAVEEPADDELERANREIQLRGKSAVTAEDRATVREETVKQLFRPALWVVDARGVQIRKLRLQGSTTRAGSACTLVAFQRTQASISDCAIVGPYGNGASLGAGSEVEMQRCFIGALWGEGITVQGRSANAQDPPAARLHLVESEVRNVFHYGVQVGPGCDSTVIEKCRISGTAWHGIRYDSASPTVTSNFIFGHARSGIYASGVTHATVRGNVFWRNEMDGISCWTANEDLIEGNTFVANERESLAVLGGSKPTIRRNLFANTPVAILCGKISSRNGGESPMGAPILEANGFWKAVVPEKLGTEDKSLPEGSIEADPGFRGAEQGDFTIAADGPLRTAQIGAAGQVGIPEKWPLLAGEKEMVPEGEVRGYQLWKKPGQTKSAQVVPASASPAKEAPPAAAAATPAPVAPAGKSSSPAEQARAAAELAKPWIDDAFQLDDTAKRAAAIERVRAALGSSNPLEVRAAIQAFTSFGPIEFDKKSFLPAVRPLLGSPDPAVRMSAAAALTMTGAEPQDLERVLAMVDDPDREVRERLSSTLMFLHQGDLTGPAGDVVVKLLASEEKQSLREVLRGTWGAKFSPALEARVIELSQNLAGANGHAYDAVYYALSPQANKSEASVKRLIELLQHPDTTNIAGRCAWGLQQGVSPAQYPLLADAMLKVIKARNDGYLRRMAVRCLESSATARDLPALRDLLASPGLPAEMHQSLERVVARVSQADGKPAVAQAAPPPASAAPAAPPAKADQPEKAEISVEWKGTWWPARVLKKDGERTQIHYLGYGAEWDEWVTADRIRLLPNGFAFGPPAPATGEVPASGPARPAAAPDVAQLTARIAELEKKLASQDAEKNKEKELADLVEKNHQAAVERARKDTAKYTPEQLKEIETLYQVANTKGKRSDEARASLKQLLEKYDSANRTGCALLYLGQASEGEERLEFLTRAVEKFSDCYYFNGCQVGGYGRYVLALTLWEKGDKDKARQLFTEIKTTYKDATDHRGRPMPELVTEAERELR